jgi:hypothetical protein
MRSPGAARVRGAQRRLRLPPRVLPMRLAVAPPAIYEIAATGRRRASHFQPGGWPPRLTVRVEPTTLARPVDRAVAGSAEERAASIRRGFHHAFWKRCWPWPGCRIAKVALRAGLSPTERQASSKPFSDAESHAVLAIPAPSLRCRPRIPGETASTDCISGIFATCLATACSRSVESGQEGSLRCP